MPPAPGRRKFLLGVASAALAAFAISAATLLAQASPSEDDDLDLMEKLGLLQGHLMIGKQLVDASMVRDGLPHFGHPVSELYTYLRPELENRQVPDFRALLDALEEQVRTVGGGARTTALYDQTLAAVDKAVQTVSADRRSSPQFVIGVIALLLQDAAMDYEESVERGSVASNVEYHDAMGFVQRAEGLLDELRATAGPEWKDKLKVADDAIAGAAQAFPSLIPPARPLRSYQVLRQSAKQVAALTR